MFAAYRPESNGSMPHVRQVRVMERNTLIGAQQSFHLILTRLQTNHSLVVDTPVRDIGILAVLTHEVCYCM